MTRLFKTLALLLIALPAFAAQQVIKTATPGSGQGDILYTAFSKANANFTDLYSFLYPCLSGPVTAGCGSNTTSIGNSVLTNTMFASMPPQTVKCNFLSVASSPLDCTATQLATFIGSGGGGGISSISFSAPIGFSVANSPCTGGNCALSLSYATGQAANQFVGTDSTGAVALRPITALALPNLSGDVSLTGGVTVINADAVTNADLANMAPSSIKCNLTGVAQNPTDCTVSQINTLIGNTGGSGGLSNQLNACSYPGIDATGTTDSVAGIKAAFAAVAGTNTALYINCPIKLTIGYDQTKPIFVHSGTNLVFGPTGKFIVDNNTIAAFVFINTVGSTWQNARIQYAGAVAINNSVSPVAGIAGSFNDTQEKAEMASQGYTFSNAGSNLWDGPTNAAATFVIRGDSHNINFINARFFVADGANASTFNPVVVSVDPEWTCCTVNGNDGVQANWVHDPVAGINNTVRAPYDVNFINCVWDGYYMGITGTGGSLNLVNPTFLRYSDLQAPDGSNPGGVLNTGAGALWLAPPHALYLHDGDVSLNAHNHIVSGYDYGTYVGGATRRPSNAGSLASLKIALTNGTLVDGWVSLRPDGCEDVISVFNATLGGAIRNMVCIFDSSTLTYDAGTIWGVRFPSSGTYHGTLFDNYTVIDKNPIPTVFPVIGNGYSSNTDVTFKNFRTFQQDGGTFPPGFQFGGTNINLQVESHFAKTSGNSTFLGPLEQGTTYCVSCNFDVTLFGWRQIPVTFSGALSAGATGGTLSPTVYPSGWTQSTGTYEVSFTSGDVRYVSFTNGSTTVGSWAALTAAATASGNIAGNALANNFNGYKPRTILYQAGKSLNSRSHILDVSNGYESFTDNGIYREMWSQLWSGTPSGTSFSTPITFPTTMAIDQRGVTASTPLSTTYSVGWSGTHTADLFSAAPASGGPPPIPVGAIPVAAATPILITSPTAQSAGNIVLSLRGSQMSSAQ